MFRSYNTIQAHPINQVSLNYFMVYPILQNVLLKNILHGLLQIHHIVHRFIS